VATAVVHSLWLQDHDPAFVDPHSGQKLRGSALVDFRRHLVAAEVGNAGADLRVTWSDQKHSQYPAHWLYEYTAESARRRRPWIYGAAQRPQLWTARDLEKGGAPSVAAEAVLHDDRTLWQLLQHVHDYGLCFVRGVPTDDVDASARIAERIGPIQDTFYGRMWDVRSIPNAYNIAYTSGDLELHQDLE